MATPTTSEFLVVPINGTDLIAFFRGSNISRPLYLRYSTFLDILSQSIGGGTTLLLQTNGVQNPTQTLLNLIQGSGITITDNGTGGVTIAATGGASFITSITDTADIDLDVTLSDLTASLTTTGVTPNTYGTATQVPQITVDSKGRITSVTLVNITAGTGSVTSVGLSMPSAFAVAGSPVTTSGTLAVTGAGTTSQYVRGDGSLATYNPGTGGGGASVSYYLNGSVAQGTFGGVAFKQMSKTPVIGAGTDFTINANGYIQSFITDASVPNQLLIPGGNWNFEMYFSASSSGGSPSFYVELYKWDGTTLTLIASSSATPEGITNGTAIDLYVTAVAVPQTVLLATDRLAIRVYVTHSGRIITLHTEDSHLCQVITTFSTGITALNGLTDQVQNFATPGTTGTAPNWNSVSPTHTLNIPLASTASVTAGLISNTDYTTFNNKVATTRAINTTAPLTGGGDLSVDRTIAMPQATSSVDGYLSSTDWGVFNNKALNYKNASDTAGYSGVTNTAVYTQLIPANKFSAGDIIRVLYRTKKTGVLGTQTLRIYVNATANLSGTPVLIATYINSGAISFLLNQIQRHLAIKSNTNNTEMFLANGTAVSSDFGLYNAVTNAVIDWTLDRYFVFAIQSNNATDVNFGSMYLIEKL